MAINSKARHDLFQFTPLREGRRGNAREAVLVCDFNSRPSARGDRWVLSSSRCRRCYFNSRPSARGDWTGAVPRGRWDRFQFTPLREGRHARIAIVNPEIDISIHAPPRGATAFLCERGAYQKYFNSRPSARGDDSAAGADGSPPAISIHAPPRGATTRRRSRWKSSGNFNSRPSARGDNPPPPRAAAPLFQFTPLREGRLVLALTDVQRHVISIHAPPRGATAAGVVGSPPADNFNSRPSARGDGLRSRGRYESRHFNSRPSARGDYTAGAAETGNVISIHAPPRGATCVDRA